MAKPYEVHVLVDINLGPVVTGDSWLDAIQRAKKLDLRHQFRRLLTKGSILDCSEVLKIYVTGGK